MTAAETLRFVEELQELRDRFDDYVYASQLPIDHCRVNFSEGMDGAVEAVLSVYAEQVLDGIQRREEVCHE